MLIDFLDYVVITTRHVQARSHYIVASIIEILRDFAGHCMYTACKDFGGMIGYFPTQRGVIRPPNAYLGIWKPLFQAEPVRSCRLTAIAKE